MTSLDITKEEEKKPTETSYEYIFLLFIISYRVIVRTATWHKDSHGLFDYECQHTIRKVIRMPTSGLLVRSGNDIKLVPLQDPMTFHGLPDTTPLCQIKKLPAISEFKLESTGISTVYEEQNDKLWLSLKNSPKDPNGKNATYILLRGDIIKLGRIKMKILDYRLDEILEGSPEPIFSEDCPIELIKYDDIPKYF